VRSQSAVARIASHDRAVIGACVFLISALAWAYLFHLEWQMASPARDTMMAKMGMPIDAAWGGPDFFITFSMWAVMMIGMMLPTMAPVLVLFAGIHAGRSGNPNAPVSVTVLLFALGYFAVWLAFSAGATLAQWILHEGAWLSSGMAPASPVLAGAILIAAGGYQLTPAKRACLTRCQSPLGFLVSNWREGAKGALEMGARHAKYCVGCCWALMCLLFAVGVMNLAWVAALTVFILIEKFGRTGAGVARAGGALMIALGVLVATR